MQINQNIPALQAWMAVNNTNNALQTTVQRLSTGYRINSAADDAAGYAITEKMLGQINGLNTAIQNSQNAISLIQTASGALTQDQAILQRMRELAVEAANDTNTTSDRQQIQQEMNQLVKQIDQIRNTTQFNTQVLLNGNLNYTGASGTATLVNPSSNIVSATISGSGSSRAVNVTTTLTINTITTGTASAPNAVQVYYNGQLLNLSTSAANNHSAGAYITSINSNEVTVYISGSGHATTVGISLQNMGTLSGSGVYTSASTAAYSVVNTGAVRLDAANDPTGKLNPANMELVFQVGANQSQTVSLGLNDMGAQALGLESTTPSTTFDAQAATNTNLGNGFYSTIDVTTQAGAQAAISIIDNANQVVSTEAAKLGALQNRITDITNNLQTSSTNLTSAEGTIKDADMAKELMTYSKQQILLQSSMAMLGQANANPQQILRLFTNLP
ncbi:flagellin N-terminal helical domain-containing protein [Athalassotoga saccharophila]|uniref:flagellin N-terminal helical domain-containing protein n=1 Tax=Athalassotoga saccharophila TaxID=1441386 RepID=UPI00137B1A28|nr:flagellin [Athalassotoga saccharophila]BBJ28884.1 flagellin B [Athalassotoga saccharophila]